MVKSNKDNKRSGSANEAEGAAKSHQIHLHALHLATFSTGLGSSGLYGREKQIVSSFQPESQEESEPKMHTFYLHYVPE